MFGQWLLWLDVIASGHLVFDQVLHKTIGVVLMLQSDFTGLIKGRGISFAAQAQQSVAGAVQQLRGTGRFKDLFDELRQHRRTRPGFLPVIIWTSQEVMAVVRAKMLNLGGVFARRGIAPVDGHLLPVGIDIDHAAGVDHLDLLTGMGKGDAVIVLVLREIDMIVLCHLQLPVVLGHKRIFG